MRLLLCCVALAAAKPAPPLIFPVAGPTTYQDDFGQPRPGGLHQGNDLMAAKKTPVVAVESGRVEFWTASASAGCMLYLHGDSGTMYEYIHLSNDVTMLNDNRGKCVAGMSYAKGLKDGQHVAAGQQVGYVGDSGDANGGAAHLHFEVHPNGRSAVDPFPFLQAAQHVLFSAKLGTPFALALTGAVVGTTPTSLTLQLATLQAFPGGTTQKGLTQQLTLATTTAIVATPGDAVTVWTLPALTTLKAMLGQTLTAALVEPTN